MESRILGSLREGTSLSYQLCIYGICLAPYCANSYGDLPNILTAESPD